LAACGTVATPEWAQEVEETRVALAATSAHETSIAPTATPTVTASPTPTTPPTATPVPPTDTPEPATEVPTDDPAAETEAAAAAAESVDTAEGDPANGEVLFTTNYEEATNFACSTCHPVDSDTERILGPSLWNVANRAETRVAGQTALEYIHNSIVNPSAFIVPDEANPYQENLMPQVYGELFTDEEINDIIAYLLTLRDE
jgi:cytochrome c